jgi:hypothetical protein
MSAETKSKVARFLLAGEDLPPHREIQRFSRLQVQHPQSLVQLIFPKERSKQDRFAASESRSLGK